MKYPISIAVTLVLLLFDAVPTRAQRPGGREGRLGRRALASDLLLLAMLPAVQDELDLSLQQEKYLEDLVEDHRNQRRWIVRRLRRSDDGGDSETRRRDFRQHAKRLNEVAEQLLFAVLEPGQAERLRQLRLQIEGVRALYRDEFLDRLQLADSQKERIRTILSHESSAPSGTDPGDGLAAQLMELLTDEQKARWQQLKGVGFSLPAREE
jgi:hypothetical protein